MHFIKKFIQDVFSNDDSLSNHSFDEQFDDESVFYIKPSITVQKISVDNDVTPCITPDTYTTSNRATPNSVGDRMSPTELVVGDVNAPLPDYTYDNDNKKENPLRMPDGQIDPYVFWLKEEKRYLFTEGRLILT
jgi:hypothetical protein